LPKVKEGYFEKKKNAILDVAEEICAKKPLNKVTMKDIIVKSGLSPGAVYASFSDIDEVIIALLNRSTLEVDFESEVERILQENESPERKVEALICYLLKLTYMSVNTYGKIISELNYIIVEGGAEKIKKYSNRLEFDQMYAYVRNKLIQVIEENIVSGYFKPDVSKESIYLMGMSIFNGIMRDLIFEKCYKVEMPNGMTFDEKDLPKAIADSVIFLLNGQKK